MKTLKDLFWQNTYMSKRMEGRANRKGMVYMSLYVSGLHSEVYSCDYLREKLRNEGCINCMPQRATIKIDEDERLIIVHVKKESMLYEALKNIGFEE